MKTCIRQDGDGKLTKVNVAHIQFQHTKQIRDDKAPVYITLPTDYKIKGLVKFVFVFAC